MLEEAQQQQKNHKYICSKLTVIKTVTSYQDKIFKKGEQIIIWRLNLHKAISGQ